MKKLFVLLSILFISIFGLTGCESPKQSYNLETIEVSSYVKDEATISGAHIFFCIFGSYKKDSKIMQRYIFLAANGKDDAYKINDIHVYSNEADEPTSGKLYHVYFKYIESTEKPYVEYSYDNVGQDAYYWLHLTRDTVLELAQDMFSDM